MFHFAILSKKNFSYTVYSQYAHHYHARHRKGIKIELEKQTFDKFELINDKAELFAFVYSTFLSHFSHF